MLSLALAKGSARSTDVMSVLMPLPVRASFYHDSSVTGFERWEGSHQAA